MTLVEFELVSQPAGTISLYLSRFHKQSPLINCHIHTLDIAEGKKPTFFHRIM